MVLRRLSIPFVFVLTVAVLGAQRPALKSGVDRANGNPAVRAQDNFYEHVNGGWIAKTEIPADKPAYGSFVELADKAESNVRAIIEGAAADTSRAAGSPAQQVGDLYSSFMNETKVESLGVTPLKPLLDRIDAIKTPADVAAVSGYLSSINAGGPVDAGVDPDAKNPATPIVYLEQGGTGLPDRDYYLKDDPKFAEIRTKYEAYLTQLFTLAGRPNAARDAKAVLALETELAKIQWTKTETRDAVKTYNKFALADLPTEMPGFDWMAWAKPQGIDRSPNVIVSEPSFFKSFAAMVPTTPIESWQAWLAAQSLRSASPFLSKPFVDATFDFFGRTLSGQPAQRERWKRGVSLVNGSIGFAVGRLYVEKHFPAASKARMQKMVGNLLEAYRESITSLDWMTPATRTQAQEKLSKFTTKIGYPDKWRDYSGLVITPDDLVGNVQRAQKFENDYQIGKLGKPIDRTEWLMTPQTVNAYYNPLLNEIVFPAAIMQPPFFDVEADDAVNYGAIGAVIGHEIGHGFDDQGRHYDGTGALRDWWTEADATEFEKRAKMLVAQYNAASPLPGVNVNGELTLGENIGDLGGVSIAFKAYQISLGDKPAPNIDGMTGEQRFFMGWAQVWRQKRREAYARQLILTDPHSPPEFRVNIPVSNVSGFYDAFDIKPGDRMFRDPKDRVKIW